MSHQTTHSFAHGYQAADMIKLVGNFVTNYQGTEIKVQDIKTAIDADRALATLARLLASLPSAETHIETISMPYGAASTSLSV